MRTTDAPRIGSPRADVPAFRVDEERIERLLGEGGAIADQQPERVRQVLEKTRQLHGLEDDEVATLMGVTDPELLAELFEAASWVKREIYGTRLVMFAPLYISNYCGNECVYCAFRRGNRAIVRQALTQEQIARETRALIDQGHKRLLVVAGESNGGATGLDYILRAIETIYATRTPTGEIRRVNVNIAPLDVAHFARLKAAGIGTYQLFQETYHRPTYAQMHLAGVKRDYDWRVNAPQRAMHAGIDDVGIGVLFGLYDWRYEVLAMLQHIRLLEQTFGVGPHTISVPRLEPAEGSPLASDPPHRMSDDDFRKLVAILRLAVPYTGLILSTRESVEMRRQTFALGISQISAGSRTTPGGYAEGEDAAKENAPAAQFQLGDHRPLDEVVRDVASMGYIPSFCTACYRMGRTGADFMDLAKPGLIKTHCEPNALASFLEYLLDYASPQTRQAGEALIRKTLDEMQPSKRTRVERMLQRLRDNQRDVYV